MGTFFIRALAAFLLLVTTVIVMVIAERNDQPRRVYAFVRALAVIAFALFVMREFIMLIAVSRP